MVAVYGTSAIHLGPFIRSRECIKICLRRSQRLHRVAHDSTLNRVGSGAVGNASIRVYR
jgi:hypothetical protein